ncbi:MAG: hypothetical protein CL811_08020 [Colwelliaceae bacterium]|nr:hypothetical protein [Colwelliaceae bacterium]
MIRSTLFLLAALLLANNAQAGIIVSDTTPASLEANAQPESDTDIFLYTEQENFTLTDDLGVDYLASTGLSGVLAAGTELNSYIFNFDAVGDDYDRGSFSAEESYSFETEILAVIWTGYRESSAHPFSANLLDASDLVLGAAGTVYSTNSNGRGLEVEDFYGANNTQDSFVVNGNQIDLELFVRAPYADQLRVITAVKVPEPNAIMLFGLALILVATRRFKSK